MKKISGTNSRMDLRQLKRRRGLPLFFLFRGADDGVAMRSVIFQYYSRKRQSLGTLHTCAAFATVVFSTFIT